MATQGCVVTEDRILHNWLSRPNCLKEFPKVGPEVIVVISVVGYCLRSGLLSRCGIVLLMPLFDIGILQAGGEGASVIARSEVNSGLRGIAHTELTKFDDALGTHKASDLC
jgi:hypothetical protein